MLSSLQVNGKAQGVNREGLFKCRVIGVGVGRERLCHLETHEGCGKIELLDSIKSAKNSQVDFGSTGYVPSLPRIFMSTCNLKLPFKKTKFAQSAVDGKIPDCSC